jgi:large subunit ribosomal protein L25
MFTLKAKLRDEKGRDTQELRVSGSIPAVLYGPGVENKNLSVDSKEFYKLYRQAGKSSLISLEVEGEKNKFMVLVNDFDSNPLDSKVIHVDFYQPDLTKEIETEVPLLFEGESLAVKDLGGTLVKNISEITVKALPADLPREIKVNIAKLATFDDVITVKDLVVGEKVELLKNAEEIVALVTPVEDVDSELAKSIEEKVEDVAQVEKKEKDVVTEAESEGKA